jgi:hypothetical protein
MYFGPLETAQKDSNSAKPTMQKQMNLYFPMKNLGMASSPWQDSLNISQGQ